LEVPGNGFYKINQGEEPQMNTKRSFGILASAFCAQIVVCVFLLMLSLLTPNTQVEAHPLEAATTNKIDPPITSAFTFTTYLPMIINGYTNTISNIVLNPQSPAALNFWEDVNISFTYTTSEQGGVQIWARPFTNGYLTPNYAAHPSIIHPYGEGTVNDAFFTIMSGAVTVDQIRFQMWTPDHSKLLLEIFVPVNYQFR
jgi:hypothetical protein